MYYHSLPFGSDNKLVTNKFPNINMMMITNGRNLSIYYDQNKLK